MNRLGLSLFILVLSLTMMGLLMVYNTTSAEIIDKRGSADLSYAFFKQLSYAICGTLLGLIVIKVGHERILKMAPILMMGLTILLVCTLLPFIGLQLNGARRWIGVFGLTFQPSEFVKIILPITFIGWLKKSDYHIDFKWFAKVLLVLAVPMGLILIEPDNGTVAIIIATMVVLFFLAQINWRYWVIPMVAVSLVGGALALQLPYVRARLRVYANPELDLLGKGHQPFQAKIAAGTGGLTGRGIGKSMQKLSYLPEARSDYIAAIYAEEFGFVGVVALTLVYMAIALIGFLIALRASTRESSLIAATLTFLIVFQAFINLGVVSGLLPSKGTNLPLFSHGGTSLIANFALIAILIDISRRAQIEEGVYEG